MTLLIIYETILDQSVYQKYGPGSDDRVDSDHGNHFINCVKFLLMLTKQLEMILPT